MTFSPKTLFLIDGLGALLSAFLLSIILVNFESAFGMSRNIVYILSAIACILSVYSLSNYAFIKQKLEQNLKIIAIANLLYCSLTVGLVIMFHKELTVLGMSYFIAELAVISTLAGMELNKASKKQ